VAIAAAACRRESALQVRYLPGFVPATQRVLPPIPIAILPVTGAMAVGEVKAGAIYNPDGSTQRTLAGKEMGPLVADAVTRCLADAGLKAFPADQAGFENPLTLSTRIESISIDKHFAAEQTIHGQYFTMRAQVKLRFTLASHMRPELYSVVTTGIETEPPTPVGGEVFLPLETEPAESLSVALSRAVGALVLDPGFRQALRAG
jgi:hypothetical protein